VAVAACRSLNTSAALLALSVLADSGVEHYRASFRNRAMYTPLAVSALSLGASLLGALDRRPRRHPARDGVYGAAALAGMIGLGFHAYNITKRPGRISWHNLFYGAPIGAPMALLLCGVLGRGAEAARDETRRKIKIAGLSLPRLLAGVAATGLAGTVGEAGLLHFRGAFQNPAMILPLAAPPVAAGFLAAQAARPDSGRQALARAWLKATALLGFAGVGFHLYGLQRQMGGWRNWRQNLLNGPPVPAPPSFTGLALAGLAALSLIEEAGGD
jgi:hypothetical protein